MSAKDSVNSVNSSSSDSQESGASHDAHDSHNSHSALGSRGWRAAEPAGEHRPFDQPATAWPVAGPPGLSTDPVHPHTSRTSASFGPTGRAPRVPVIDPDLPAVGTAPLAAGLGTPAVLEHRVVAIDVGSAIAPMAIRRWTGARVETLLVHPCVAHVWSRAGRLTVVSQEGVEHRFTVLAPEEAEGRALGECWPPHQAQSRAGRIVHAAVHDAGDVLTFPLWLKRTMRTSAQRNQVTCTVLRRIQLTSPRVRVHWDAAFGVEHPKAGQLTRYAQRTIVGREGFPREHK